MIKEWDSPVEEQCCLRASRRLQFRHKIGRVRCARRPVGGVAASFLSFLSAIIAAQRFFQPQVVLPPHRCLEPEHSPLMQAPTRRLLLAALSDSPCASHQTSSPIKHAACPACVTRLGPSRTAARSSQCFATGILAAPGTKGQTIVSTAEPVFLLPLRTAPGPYICDQSPHRRHGYFTQQAVSSRYRKPLPA